MVSRKRQFEIVENAIEKQEKLDFDELEFIDTIDIMLCNGDTLSHSEYHLLMDIARKYRF
jgi:hypothetical protein